LTTFIDHRHDQLEEELTPELVISGRADNGTNDQYCVLKFCHRIKLTHLRAQLPANFVRRKGARRLPPGKKDQKWVGVACSMLRLG